MHQKRSIDRRLARVRPLLRGGMHYRYNTRTSLYERCVRVCVRELFRGVCMYSVSSYVRCGVRLCDVSVYECLFMI